MEVKVVKAFFIQAIMADLLGLDLLKTPVTFIENINLLFYTRLEDNNTVPTKLELHLGVYPSEIQLPDDDIDYKYQIVPILEWDISIHNFLINYSRPR